WVMLLAGVLSVAASVVGPMILGRATDVVGAGGGASGRRRRAGGRSGHGAVRGDGGDHGERRGDGRWGGRGGPVR
ncbi:hypothetical protein ACWCPG_24910, partial [Streptomyces sp. NPDC001919]